MRKSEIATIILVASVSSVIAFFIASSIPVLKLPEDGVKVDTFQEISAEVVEPSEKIFNSDAINPTVTIQTETNSP